MGDVDIDANEFELVFNAGPVVFRVFEVNIAWTEVCVAMEVTNVELAGPDFRSDAKVEVDASSIELKLFGAGIDWNGLVVDMGDVSDELIAFESGEDTFGVDTFEGGID